MPVRSEFGYRAEISTWTEGRPVQVVELCEPDWEPALQWSYFQQVRTGERKPVMRCPDGGIEPVWDADLGEPFVSGFRVQPGTRRNAASTLPVEIPSRYLRPAVEVAASRLVREGRLVEGEPFRFRLLAGPVPSQPRPPLAHDGIRSQMLPQPLPIVESSHAQLAFDADPRDGAAADPVDMRVVVRAAVLDAALSLAAATPDVESGGVLVGALCRDTDDADLFLDVRALIPVRHAVARQDRLTFTPDTWADARAAIALRGGDECWVGWAHSHPFFCRACPPEVQRRCVLSQPFLSEHDRSLHRTVFGRPFDVALLVTDAGPAGCTCALFGWRRGMIERRGYMVAGRAAAASSPAEALPHATEERSAIMPRVRDTRSVCGGRDADATA